MQEWLVDAVEHDTAAAATRVCCQSIGLPSNACGRKFLHLFKLSMPMSSHLQWLDGLLYTHPVLAANWTAPQPYIPAAVLLVS
jgi:hypothetical protein